MCLIPFLCLIKLVSVFTSALNIVLWFRFLGVSGELPGVTLHKDPAFDIMFVGEQVVLTCNMNVEADMEYSWIRNGNIFSLEKGSNIIIPLVALSGGNYSCRATRGATEVTSEQTFIRVQGK